MKKEMLINVSQPEECRIAIIEDGLLEELYIERASQDNFVGNIYRGRIVNLEPSIQAAFVDFGVGRNGFLHISDVEPQYFRQGGFDPALADGGRMGDIDTGEDDIEDGPEPMDDAEDADPDNGGEGDAGRRRPPRNAAGFITPRGRGSSHPFKIFCAAATKCWCRSSRKASAAKARRSPRTSVSPAATWC